LGAFVPAQSCASRKRPDRGVLNGRTFAVKDLNRRCRLPATGAGNPTWLAQQAPAERSVRSSKKRFSLEPRLSARRLPTNSLQSRRPQWFTMTPDQSACPDRLPGGSSSGSAWPSLPALADLCVGHRTPAFGPRAANFLGLFGFPSESRRNLLDGRPCRSRLVRYCRMVRARAELLAGCRAALLPADNGADPIAKLFLAHDAFALVDKPLARELEAKAAELRLLGATPPSSMVRRRPVWNAIAVLQGAESGKASVHGSPAAGRILPRTSGGTHRGCRGRDC